MFNKILYFHDISCQSLFLTSSRFPSAFKTFKSVLLYKNERSVDEPQNHWNISTQNVQTYAIWVNKPPKLYWKEWAYEAKDWIGRKQIVFINNFKSDVRKIDVELPQGSMLEPVLFIISINDSPRLCIPPGRIVFMQMIKQILNMITEITQQNFKKIRL